MHAPPDTHDSVKRQDTGWRAGHILPDTVHHRAFAAQQVQTAAPEKKQSVPAEEDTKPGKGPQEVKPPPPTDKKPPTKDFQPSEKIDADKAVDFPADI